jgi:class 3 adenylate cyclase
MFVDIRGFTALAEQLEPAAVAAQLNRFYEVASKAIFRYDGTLHPSFPTPNGMSFCSKVKASRSSRGKSRRGRQCRSGEVPDGSGRQYFLLCSK